MKNLNLSKCTLNEFNSKNLAWELLRLKNLFLPEFDVPNVIIGMKTQYTIKAAETYCGRNEIVMYRRYHEAHPEEYKSTLLHELGHVIADHTHGENFKKYYKLLWERQRSIEEQVIPDSYCDFLYSQPVNHFSRSYFCPVCREEKLYRKKMAVSCKSCGIPMMEDLLFDEIEAIFPLELRASVNRSVEGVSPLRQDECIV